MGRWSAIISISFDIRFDSRPPLAVIPEKRYGAAVLLSGWSCEGLKLQMYTVTTERPGDTEVYGVVILFCPGCCSGKSPQRDGILVVVSDCVFQVEQKFWRDTEDFPGLRVDAGHLGVKTPAKGK